MIFGTDYAIFYDQIHSDKAYNNESMQIIKFIKKHSQGETSKFLDFGCGTGMHMSIISNLGYSVDGYDISKDMLSQSQKRLPNCTFYSDINEIPRIFDFTYSLFDVMSYQVDDDSAEIFLSNLISVTKNRGRVLIDAWHLNGLLIEPPTNRSKIFEFKGRKYCRNVEVQAVDSARVTNLKIEIIDMKTNDLVLKENHIMRAFEKKELINLITKVGGHNIEFFDGNIFSKGLLPNSWRIGSTFEVHTG